VKAEVTASHFIFSLQLTVRHEELIMSVELYTLRDEYNPRTHTELDLSKQHLNVILPSTHLFDVIYMTFPFFTLRP